MSYSCEISFKRVDSIAEVFNLLPAIKAEIINHIPEIAKDNAPYMPISRLRDEPEKRDLTQPDIARSLYNWARASVFSYRIFYIESLSLIGIFGLPECVHHCMDGTVYFQNSCDQDYPRDTYEGIPAFLDIYDSWMKVTAEDYIARCSARKGSELTDEEIEQIRTDPDCLLYQLQTAAYDQIWSYCKDSLYDDDTVVSVGLFKGYDLKHIQRFIVHAMDAMREEYKWLWGDDEEEAETGKQGMTTSESDQSQTAAEDRKQQ